MNSSCGRPPGQTYNALPKYIETDVCDAGGVHLVSLGCDLDQVRNGLSRLGTQSVSLPVDGLHQADNLKSSLRSAAQAHAHMIWDLCFTYTYFVAPGAQ